MTPVTLVPMTAETVPVPAPEPWWVKVPVWFMEVVLIVVPVEPLSLSVKLPVPVVPPEIVSVPKVFVIVVPELFTVIAPLIVNALVEEFCVIPVTLLPMTAEIIAAPVLVP